MRAHCALAGDELPRGRRRATIAHAGVAVTRDPERALSRHEWFTREEWARLADDEPLPLTEADLAHLRGLNEPMSLAEVGTVYLPLARLIHLHVIAGRQLRRSREAFLGRPRVRVPYVVGMAGSVAAGKSTTARILRALLGRFPEHPRVDLVTTDGFLHPNRVLEARGLLRRKGFPESYDQRRLLAFMADLKAGREVEAPVYSHRAYDVLPTTLRLEAPDVVLVEGLKVLQAGPAEPSDRVFVSDFFDLSLYVDAEEADLERWYVERFLALCTTVFQDPGSYFHRYAALDVAAATDVARSIWREINGVNLAENVRPTRERAHLVLEKGPDHAIRRVRLRRW
jgi:type I pantothenate kinase